MATKLFSTGPYALYLKHALDSTPSFLGWGEKAPDISEHPAYGDVHADFGGPSFPVDVTYHGAEARISGLLTKFDQGVLNLARARSRNISVQSVTPGYDPPGATGHLAIAEGATFTVWCRFLFASKAAFQEMPAGYQFFTCLCLDLQDIGGTGAARKVSFTFRALRTFRNESNSFGFAGFQTYDHSMSAVSGITIS